MEAVNQILKKIENVSSKIKDADESPLLKPLVEANMEDLDKQCENLRVRSLLAVSPLRIVVIVLFCHTIGQVFFIQDEARSVFRTLSNM